MLFSASLLFHIAGIALMAGGTAVDFMLVRRFWNLYSQDQRQGLIVKKLSDQLSGLIIAGVVLILLSGIGMMAATDGAFGETLWFRIKITLVVLVILNRVLVWRRINARLNQMLAADSPPINQNQVRKNQNLFYISQLALFFIIFFLSAFKFN